MVPQSSAAVSSEDSRPHVCTVCTACIPSFFFITCCTSNTTFGQQAILRRRLITCVPGYGSLVEASSRSCCTHKTSLVEYLAPRDGPKSMARRALNTFRAYASTLASNGVKRPKRCLRHSGRSWWARATAISRVLRIIIDTPCLFRQGDSEGNVVTIIDRFLRHATLERRWEWNHCLAPALLALSWTFDSPLLGTTHRLLSWPVRTSSCL